MAAEIHNAFFKVNAINNNCSVKHPRKIVAYRKAEITLSAAQIRHTKHTVLRQMLHHISHMLQKAVYLTEFRLFFVMDTSAFI